MSSEMVAAGPSVARAATQRSVGILWVVAITAIALLPHIVSSSSGLALLVQMCIAVVFALSFNLLFGQTGLLSFGHAVMMGIPSDFAIHLIGAIGETGWGFPIAFVPLAAGLFGLAFGVIFALFAAKRSGTAFSMITYGMGELFLAAASMFPSLSGGESGVTADRTSGLPLFGFDLGTQIQVYYLAAGWAVVSAFLVYTLIRTPLGYAARAVRDNSERVEFIGYRPVRIRFLMLVLSGLFAGIAGGLYAINYEIVTTASLGFEASTMVLLMAYLGGRDSFVGPIIGAVALTFLQYKLSQYTEIWLLYLGIIFVLMVIFAPGGITGQFAAQLPYLHPRYLHRSLPLYAILLTPTVVLALAAYVLIETAWSLTVYKPSVSLALFNLKLPLAAAPLLFSVACVVIVSMIVLLKHTSAIVRLRFHDLSPSPNEPGAE